MNQDMSRETLVRKKYIETFVEMLYGRFSHLFPEGLKDLKKKAIDRYLYTDLTYDDITKEMISIIEKRKEEREKKLQEKEIPKERLIELQTKKETEQIPIQENPVVTTEPPVVKNELSEMFSTPEPVKSNKVQENDIHKQLVKKNTPDTSNKESGVISIFNISLALLIMTGLILIAMILNVVLK